MIIVPPSQVQQAIMVPYYAEAGSQQAFIMPAPQDMEAGLLQPQLKINSSSNDALPEDYKSCARFNKSRFSSISPECLFNIRNVILLINMMIFSVTLLIEDWDYFFFYESEWGFLLTIFSLIASAKASGYTPTPTNAGNADKQAEWQNYAMITAEIAFALNLVITPIFWILMAKEIFPYLPNHGWGLILQIVYATHHLFPLITSILNLVLTDQYFAKRDYKMLFKVGLAYLGANLFGTWYTGQSVYGPPFDWDKPLTALFFFVLQAFILSGFHYGTAWISQKFYKKPTH